MYSALSPGGRLPLLSARPAVTFPVEERHRPSAAIKLYCLVTEAFMGVNSLPKAVSWKRTGRNRLEPATFWSTSERFTVMPHKPLEASKLLHQLSK